MAAEKRYSVFFTVREKGLRELKKQAFKKDLPLSTFVRSVLEEKKVISREE